MGTTGLTAERCLARYLVHPNDNLEAEADYCVCLQLRRGKGAKWWHCLMLGGKWGTAARGAWAVMMLEADCTRGAQSACV